MVKPINSIIGYEKELRQNINETLLKSILVCPKCGFIKEEIRFTNSCQYFYNM